MALARRSCPDRPRRHRIEINQDAVAVDERDVLSKHGPGRLGASQTPYHVKVFLSRDPLGVVAFSFLFAVHLTV